MENVIVIFGPTASGKTSLSIELAKELNGEIISADSMQVYKHMNIGTAKPDEEERQGINHYLIDEIELDQEFNVTKFQELAYKYIELILKKGKIPIIVGGTGLYINSLLYNINFSETISDWELRDRLKKEAEEKGNKYIHDMLRNIDEEAAAKIHENDIKRVIRAIEVYEHTKKTISDHQQVSRLEPPRYNFIKIGITMDRQKLYDRINKRVDLMLEKGLVDEVNRIISMGYDKNSVAMQGLGYKEIIAFLRGESNWDETVELLKRDTRRYAKRQLTWFRRIEDVYWLEVDKMKSSSEVLKNIKDYIAISGIFL